MSALNSFLSKQKGRENLHSETEQPVHTSVLPPFTGELNIDKKLKLSHEEFKKTIDDFYKDKNITALSQLTETPVFPTPYVLAQFANKAYTDYKRRETDAQYERRLKLPDDWKLLTTASNTGMSNGYFGAAYWHSEHQQVVIAHRGTIPKRWGPLWTDLKGVLYNKYVRQMDSASTFAYKVVEVLRDVTQEKGTNFQVFFTGHSLGGWLAQITTFTTEYLKTEGNTFLKSNTVSQSYHPHTVVFDSPGCKDMLSQMADKFDVRMKGRSVDSKVLDITSYLSAPNRVNTCNQHVGTVYRVFSDLSDMAWWQKYTALYNLAAHSMQKIVDAFEREARQVAEDEQGKDKKGKDEKSEDEQGKDEKGKDEKGEDGKGKDEKGEDGKGKDEKGEDGKGKDEKGEDGKGKDEKGEDGKGKDEKGEDRKGKDEKGEDGKGKDEKGEDGKGKDEKGEDGKGKDEKGEDGKGKDGKGKDKKGEGEQGQKKVLVVVDWPDSTGLSHGKEYKRFFKWATHLNDYHTEKREEYLRNGCYPIRYQTKKYDDRVASISIFSQEERQFLEEYRQLCQLPEFFRPKEMFSAIGNEQAQREAENKLQSFEIENETIRCTDASALQALIPYVKRLLQHFPEIKENTKCALSPQEVRNSVYQIGTKRYLEMFHQSPLEFKPYALSLSDFLDSDEQKVLHLRMVDGDAWTGLIKVYQVMQKTPSMTDFCSEGHYTVLTLQHLLLVNQMVSLNALMESTTTPHLLMMSCESSQLCIDETKHILGSLFNTLMQKSSIKMILATQSENDTIAFLQNIARETLSQEQLTLTVNFNQMSDDETKQIFGSLFKTVTQKQSVKIILTTHSEDGTVTFQEDTAKETPSNGLVTRDEKLTWTDLTRSSQEKLLENAVNFEGSKIALNQLIPADSRVTNLLPLADLLDKKRVKIGEEPVAYSKCDFYDERYYIDRTFHHRVIIKQDVFNENGEQKFPDFLVSTEQEFKQLCQENPKSNVHWLHRDNSGKLVWQQSQGSLEALRKYIDTDSSHTYTPDDLDRLLEQAHKQRVMLISDTAGMGKSTILTHLSKQIKQKFPAKWVVRIDLNDHTDALEALKGEEIDKEKAVQFLLAKMLKLESDLEIELFRQCFEQKQKLNAVVMLDSFDKISPSYKETVMHLLQALRQTAVEQLWVTTRPHLREDLEDELQQFSYTLEPFSEENQVEFLTKFWSVKDSFTYRESMEKQEKKVQLEVYAKHLIMKLAQSVCYNDKEFTGIPLQCRMLAEAFDEEVKTFFQTAASMPESRFKLDLLGLHKTFMNRKKDICVEETFKISGTNVGAQLAQTQYLKKFTEDHQLLALKVLFGEEQVALLEVNSQCKSSDEDLIRAGIVQKDFEGKLHFIHRTFAEYYAAEFLVNQLTKSSNTSQQVQDHLLQKIFLEDDHRVVRGFIDGLLPSAKPSKEVLKQYGNRISVLRRDGALMLHQAAHEGHANISGFLLDSVLAGGHTDTVHEMLLAQDNDSHTAWHLAAMGGHTAALEKLWECANEKLTKGELVKELLLNRDNWGQTAWHYASLRGYVEVLQKLWEWGKETLTAEDLYDKLFLAKDNKERTAWHLAAKNGNPEILQNLWEWGKEKLTAEELNSKLLLAKDNTGRRAWHLAAKNGNLEVLQKMWECGKEIRTGQDLNNKLLFAKDHWGQTAWHFASLRGNVEVLQKLWDWGKDALTAEELNDKLLVAKDNWGQTAWNYASLRDNADTLRKMWTYRKEILTAEEQKNKLFAKDNKE